MRHTRKRDGILDPALGQKKIHEAIHGLRTGGTQGERLPEGIVCLCLQPCLVVRMATWEREEIADRQKASILVRAKLGKTINGRAPYGYQWKNRQLVSHPDEAPIRRKAYELFLQYRRKGTVAKLLNAAGHRTREGATFSDTQLGRILTCPSAKGVYYFNRTRKNGPWKGTEKPEEEWGEAKCDAIISEDLWNEVNKIIEEQSKQYKKVG